MTTYGVLLDLTAHNNEFLSIDIVQLSAQYLDQSCAVEEKVVQNPNFANITLNSFL